MGGSATMGSSLVDEMVLVADDLRALRGELGADQYRVYRVLRTWLGEPGDAGGFADEEEEITPTPIVRPSLRHRQEAHGVEEAGEIVLEEVSLTYTHDELKPSLGADQELLYKLVDQHGQGVPDRYFVLAAPPLADRVKTIGWVLRLRKADA